MKTKNLRNAIIFFTLAVVFGVWIAACIFPMW